jgi:hypothetical protein
MYPHRLFTPCTFQLPASNICYISTSNLFLHPIHPHQQYSQAKDPYTTTDLHNYILDSSSSTSSAMTNSHPTPISSPHGSITYDHTPYPPLPTRAQRNTTITTRRVHTSDHEVEAEFYTLATPSRTKPSFTAKAKALKTKVADKVRSPPKEKSQAELEHERRVAQNEKDKNPYRRT